MRHRGGADRDSVHGRLDLRRHSYAAAVLLSIVLAVPGFIGWIVPIFLYRWMVGRRTQIVDELKERKYDEIYEICEKGHRLLL